MEDNHESYQQEVYRKGLHYETPALTFDYTQWESLAKSKLSADSFGYVAGSAGMGLTCQNNLAAFRNWGLLPSRLVEDDTPDLSVPLFGHKYQFPIAFAPVGVLEIFHPDKEFAVARAAQKQHILSF